MVKIEGVDALWTGGNYGELLVRRPPLDAAGNPVVGQNIGQPPEGPTS